ncbi:SLC13 family permease [Anaerotignum sp.]|uniref:SLC13 family permease n=1 Tax=Anaerotignum sp. TaxID=2039241 RepID=UPI003735DC4D
MGAKLIAFFKKETILCVAGLLAVLSMIWIPPDREYMGYINWQVLVLLFCLMSVMGGLQTLGIFKAIANALLHWANGLKQLTLLLVLLCFFFAMVVTNDVALITFVPFTILLLQMAELTKEMIPILVLQTIAANLGSMLTPIGNPQNLYLYTVSGMSPADFVLTMLPLTLLSLFLLVLCCLLTKDVPLSGQMLPPMQGEAFSMGEKVTLSALLMLFAACLMTVFHVMPYWTVLGISLVWFVFFERDVLGKVDYSLLITFIFFFVFIGNMGRIPAMRDAIASILAGREMMVSFLCSQIISNVPAAVLLSGFTDHWRELLFGVNIGGLGTLIASMASLISYKFFVQAEEKAKGKYLKHFTIMNILFAIPLLVVAFFL